MKSANLVQIGKIVIDEHCPEPKLTSPEQTLVRVRYAAINADDYSAFARYLGRFYNSQRLLHEFSGEIVALGPQAAAQGRSCLIIALYGQALTHFPHLIHFS